jgi:phosphate:Na+ symporter
MGAGSVMEIVNGDHINIARYIANGHTIFNIINALIFLFFLPWLVKVSVILSPKPQSADDGFMPPKFDDRFIDNPIAALTHVRKEIIKMSETAMTMLQMTSDGLVNKNLKRFAKWRMYENLLDATQKEIIVYLTRIYQGDLNEAEAKEISGMMRMTNNIERIGDSIENVAIIAENMIENDIDFSSNAIADLKTISDLTIKFLKHVTDAIHQKPDDFMKQSQIMEDDIDFSKEEMRQGHINRLKEGVCTSEPGLMYSDALSNFEKMGDYCYNIAQAIAGVK